MNINEAKKIFNEFKRHLFVPKEQENNFNLAKEILRESGYFQEQIKKDFKLTDTDMFLKRFSFLTVVSIR